MKSYFLNRQNELIEVKVVSETPFKREVVFLEGENNGKKINVHPKGVAWGSIYPRIFELSEKTDKIFNYKGRTLVNQYPVTERHKNAVPTAKEYMFQPFIKDVIDSIHAGENVLLTGGTGVGKTTHIVQLAARINQPISRINFNGETRMSDLIGKMTVINGETRWVDGVLPYAMRHGYWILFDEIDFADPAVLSLLHPVLESDPMLTLKENGGEIIKPHPLFRVFATANSIGAMSDRADAYGGTNEMNEAFLDRWQVLMVDNLPPKEEVKVIKNEAPGLNASVAKKIVAFANMARKNKFDDSSASYMGDNFSTRKVVAWAKKSALHRDPIIGAQKSWLDKMPISEQEVMKRILMTQFGGKTKRNSSKGKLKLLNKSASSGRRCRPPKVKKLATGN